ncbi:hypothetical protein [Flammeovirga sp. EKP202]|uniref:hypothetical protein n=1 Tax=Flammeovirga sp. EKP202 TaxID=2770592 RepID=UPI00165F2BE0|nr:hypothetical protein [Flammeovirga sp. EKP202]MBD0401496.1 hypothetical protein [Flammeovirga sp. EKP202]
MKNKIIISPIAFLSLLLILFGSHMLYNNLEEINILQQGDVIQNSLQEASTTTTTSVIENPSFGVNKLNLAYMGVVISVTYLLSGILLFFNKESFFNPIKVILIISILFSTFQTFFNLSFSSNLLFHTLVSENIASIIIDMMILVFFIIEVLKEDKEEKSNDLKSLFGF